MFTKDISIRWFLILLVLFLIPTFFTLLRPGFFPMQDDLQAFRLHQMNECFKDFQIPCRWIPDMGYQYGYPQFNFYSPFVYYVGQIFQTFKIQFIDVVKVLFALGFLGQGLAMFLFLKEIFNKWAGFVGGLLYVYAPFKAAQVYVRGSLSEFWAEIFFPLIFWAILKIVKDGDRKYVLLLGIFSGFLLLTHNLMSLIFFPIAAIWAGILIFLEKKRFEKFKKVGLGFLLGGGLSAFFVLPVLFERQFVHVESILSGYFDYRQHFVNLNQLFLSNYFGYGSSVLGNNDEVTLSVGILHWIIALIGILLGIIYFKKNRKVSLIIFSLAGVELLIMFLMHQRSSFLWEQIKVLVWLQFPWRFLALSFFLLSIIGASVFYFLDDKFKSIKIALVLTIISLMFGLYQNDFKPLRWLDISDTQKFSGESWEKQLTISIFDYLPIYAELPPISKAPAIPEVLSGEVKFLKYQKRSDYQVGEVEVLEDAKLRLPLFDFPGMSVSIDGKRISHSHNDCSLEPHCLGLINFNVSKGAHIIKAQLKDTPVRVIGNLVSLVTLVVLLGFYVPTKIYAKAFKK